MAQARTQAPESPPERLSDKERSYVFSVAMKYMKDEDAAADVAQDALLLAHRYRHSFRGSSRYSTWLYRIAATTSLMHLRKQRRRWREVLVPLQVGEEHKSDPLERPAPQASPEEQWASREAIQIVRRRLEELGEKYGDIFMLRFFDGYTESEIAKRLELNVATVKTRAYRARLAVRKQLEQELQQAA
jgi:RNA polymerase sigma-70 factor (ECF subfamily)